MPALEVLREPYSKQLKRSPAKETGIPFWWLGLSLRSTSQQWRLRPSRVDQPGDSHCRSLCRMAPFGADQKCKVKSWHSGKTHTSVARQWKNKANGNCTQEETLPPATRNRALSMGTRKDTTILQTFHLPPGMPRVQMFIFASLLTSCRQETNYKK